MQEYAERAGQKGVMILLDWEKAFDKIEHEWLFRTLDYFEVPEEISDLVKNLYKKPQFYVEIDGVKSKTATQTTGIRQ